MIAPCLKCGTPTEHHIELTGALAAEVFMCDGCFTPAMAGFEECRRQFQELLDAGVPRDRANAIMIERIEGAQMS